MSKSIGPLIPYSGCTVPESMYEPSCLGCLGLYVVCEETSYPVMRPYAHSSFDFRENTISTWGPEYKLSFDIKPIYKNHPTTPHTYVFQFYTEPYNGLSCADHYAKWTDDSKRLRLFYCVNNVKSTVDYELNRLEWSQIEMGQRLVGESSYEFYIKIRLGFRKMPIKNFHKNSNEKYQNVHFLKLIIKWK